MLLVISVPLTLILSLFAYRFIGPLGVIAAVIVGVVGPRLTVVHIAKRRVKQFVY